MIEPTESSMPPEMMTNAWAEREQTEQADQVGGVGEIDRRQEPRIEDGHHCPHDQDQEQEPQLLLQHAASAIVGRPRAPTRCAR